MKKIILFLIFISFYGYSQSDFNSSTYRYYDNTSPRVIPNDKVKIHKDKTPLIIASTIGFGGGQGYLKKWKLFGVFFSMDLLDLSFLITGGAMYAYFQSQIISHGFAAGDVDSFFNERYISEDWKRKRKVHYYSSFVLMSLGALIYIINKAFQINNIIQFNKSIRLKKQRIKVGYNADGTLGVTYRF